jgi:hypothetical protein
VKEPPRVSHPSSPLDRPPVNGVPAVDASELVQSIIGAEKRIRVDRPRRPRRKPDGADRVLEALARAHRPGDRIDTAAIAAAAGVTHRVAEDVRRWAKAERLWPYLDVLTGFLVRPDRDWPRRRKGGGD